VKTSRKLTSPHAFRILALVACVAACLGLANGCGCSVRIGGKKKLTPSFPVGRELSTVPGVSIVCMDQQPSLRQATSSVSGGSASVQCTGRDLLSSLRLIRGGSGPRPESWGERPAIVCHGTVPQGYFRINARTKHGGRDQLIRLVCQAFTQAGDWRVSLRLVETEVTALTCSDPEALGFTLGPGGGGSSGGGGSRGGTWSVHGEFTVARFATVLTEELRESATEPGQEPASSTRFVDETGVKGAVKGRIEWQQGDHASLLAALRKVGLVPVIKCRLAWAIVVEPKASTSVSSSSLLGASESQLVDVYGKPSDRGGPSEEGRREFFYDQPGKQISFLVVKGTVRGVGIRSGATLPLSETIGIGAPMQRVTDLCGGYTSEQDIGKDTPSDDLQKGVLYKQTLPGDVFRYRLHYPELKLHFSFLPDRTLHTIWIGEPR